MRAFPLPLAGEGGAALPRRVRAVNVGRDGEERGGVSNHGIGRSFSVAGVSEPKVRLASASPSWFPCDWNVFRCDPHNPPVAPYGNRVTGLLVTQKCVTNRTCKRPVNQTVIFQAFGQ